MNVIQLQGLLGHSTLEMTRHYIEMLDEDLVKAHKKHGPVDSIFTYPIIKNHFRNLPIKFIEVVFLRNVMSLLKITLIHSLTGNPNRDYCIHCYIIYT